LAIQAPKEVSLIFPYSKRIKDVTNINYIYYLFTVYN